MEPTDRKLERDIYYEDEVDEPKTEALLAIADQLQQIRVELSIIRKNGIKVYSQRIIGPGKQNVF